MRVMVEEGGRRKTDIVALLSGDKLVKICAPMVRYSKFAL
jgi:hypothetical protein